MLLFFNNDSIIPTGFSRLFLCALAHHYDLVRALLLECRLSDDFTLIMDVNYNVMK